VLPIAPTKESIRAVRQTIQVQPTAEDRQGCRQQNTPDRWRTDKGQYQIETPDESADYAPDQRKESG
jgi:hypothetical protein